MKVALESFRDENMNQRQEEMEMRLSLRDFSTSPDDTANPSVTDIESTTTLSEDTFSFLIVAPTCSISFITGILVIAIKTTMYTLILADMMTKGAPNNILGIPASLELPVVVSQILAVASKYPIWFWISNQKTLLR
jgi:hypothetical protein